MAGWGRLVVNPAGCVFLFIDAGVVAGSHVPYYSPIHLTVFG